MNLNRLRLGQKSRKKKLQNYSQTWLRCLFLFRLILINFLLVAPNGLDIYFLYWLKSICITLIMEVHWDFDKISYFSKNKKVKMSQRQSLKLTFDRKLVRIPLEYKKKYAQIFLKDLIRKQSFQNMLVENLHFFAFERFWFQKFECRKFSIFLSKSYRSKPEFSNKLAQPLITRYSFDWSR